MRQLNPREEAFCQLWGSGKANTMSEAVRAAYQCGRLSDSAVNEKASKLSKRPHIVARLAELQVITKAVLEEQFSISTETKLRWLKSIVEDAMTPKTHTTQDDDGKDVVVEIGMRSRTGAISAIDQINKMDGGHAAQRIDMNATISQAERVKALKEKRQ